MSFLAACCSSAPSDRRKKPGRSGSATSPSDRAAQAPTPTGRKRFRVGQPVEMLDERRAKAAYEAHEFRHPVSSKSLLELSWASQAQPRCGTRGTVTEVNTARRSESTRAAGRSGGLRRAELLLVDGRWRGPPRR